MEYGFDKTSSKEVKKWQVPSSVLLEPLTKTLKIGLAIANALLEQFFGANDISDANKKQAVLLSWWGGK